MKNTVDALVEDFEHTQWSLFRDQEGRSVSISSLEEFSGEAYLLIHNQLKGVYAQIRFAEGELGQWWTHFAENEFGLFPQIHDVGNCGTLQYCISDIPEAEQIQSYINRNGAMAPEAAVVLIRKLIRSLEMQPLKLHASFAIDPSSIWIGRTKSEPLLCFGEIRGVNHPNPIEQNIRLFVDMLGFITDRCDDPAFLALCENVVQSTSLLEVDQYLTEFLPQTTSCYLSSYSKPASLHERITDHYNPTEVAAADKRSIDLMGVAKKAVWPVALVLIISLLAIFNNTSFSSKLNEAQTKSNGIESVVEIGDSQQEYVEFSAPALKAADSEE